VPDPEHQILTLASSEAVATERPSGEKHADCT